MGKQKAPTPPDPMETSAAQTGTNIGTAIANNTMGMVNQYTPDGSLTYETTGTQSYTDPYTGQTYDLPQYSATTQLSPEQQAIQEQNRAAQLNLASVANERSDFLQNYLPGTEAVTDQIDNKLYDMGAQRLDPRFQQQESDLRSRLAQQGITPGSEAFNREMTNMSQGRNDAYNQLALSGRGQALAEVNQPINQITALLSGSQVSNPNVNMAQPAQIATTDNAGLINANYNQRYQGVADANANKSALLGGLFDAAGAVGSAGITASDARLKSDIVRTGEINGLGVYEYRYLGSARPQVGLMAQEVIKTKPHAVIIRDGFAEVNYAEALA